MAKARSPKEKFLDTDIPVAEAVEEEKPKRRTTRTKAADREETPEKPARRRTTRREEDTSAAEPPRPVLTPIPSHPVRDEEYQEVRAAVEAEVEQPAALAAPEPAPVAAEVTRGGTEMQVMSLNDLKRMKITELAKMAHDFNIEGYQGLKKQDLIFALLSGIAAKRCAVHAEGVFELLQDGFGFLRSADSDYQPSPDDIYVSPSQVRRYNLRPGDTVSGPIRQPREGERFFALLRT
ncbi:MAG TPA: Rho termination factor N-terminal domain-containing protein, partial [Myxococcaceae bacterium]|nr:Rho termination factor N-terminal domain-containing protein [Myxococcaceae bacterium]